MFETALDPTTLHGWQRSLSRVLDTESGLDDAGRVDAIRALEEVVCAATAAQARLATELDESQRAEQARARIPSARQGRGVAAQVALARRESHHRGRLHLSLAKVVTRELPHMWAAWGEPSATNGQGLCQACNHAKQDLGWRARPAPAPGPHGIETTTPTGHRYRSRAPAVATIREVPIRIDYVLTG